MEEGLIIHQARHGFADVHWLYMAVSRATRPSNVRVLDDIHRSESDMSYQDRVSWVSRKVSSCIYAHETAGRLGPAEGGRTEKLSSKNSSGLIWGSAIRDPVN